MEFKGFKFQSIWYPNTQWNGILNSITTFIFYECNKVKLIYDTNLYTQGKPMGF